MIIIITCLLAYTMRMRASEARKKKEKKKEKKGKKFS